MGRLILIGIIFSGFMATTNGQELISGEQIKWVSISQAVELAKQDNKKIFIDIYTDWCGWCKRMDATTLQDADVITYLNNHFHSVKLDGEHKGTLTLKGKEYSFRTEGRRGYNELAHELMNGRLGYPTVVYLDGNAEVIVSSPGFKPSEKLLKELQFIKEEVYKTTTLQEFMRSE